MGIRGYDVGRAAIAVVGVWAASASGSITVTSDAFAQGAPSSSHEGTSASSSFVDDSENMIGGHGYSQVRLDFAGGLITSRNHACVGPAFGFSDQAGANGAVRLVDEVFTVMNDNLPSDTMIDIVLCLSISSDVAGDVRDGAAGNNFSRNIFSARLDGQTVASGSHTADSGWQNTYGSGIFASVDNRIATFETSVAFSIRVGRTFDFSLSGVSTSQASDINNLPFSFPLATGSAGYAITFGVSSMTEGAHLDWNGQVWTGSCESSAALIPPNPITPAPSSVGAIGLGLAIVGRRRRCPRVGT